MLGSPIQLHVKRLIQSCLNVKSSRELLQALVVLQMVHEHLAGDVMAMPTWVYVLAAASFLKALSRLTRHSRQRRAQQVMHGHGHSVTRHQHGFAFSNVEQNDADSPFGSLLSLCV